MQDKSLKPVVDRMHNDVGLMLIAHVGRIAQVAAPIAAAQGGADIPPAMMNMATGQMQTSLDTTIVYLGLAQGETEMNVRLCLAGLPNVNQLLKQFGPMARMAMNFENTQPRRPRNRRTRREPAAVRPVNEKKSRQDPDDTPHSENGDETRPAEDRERGD